jgi:hypothetical protein
MLKLIKLIKNLFNPLYQVVYQTKDGRTEMYTINKPQYTHEFGNNAEGLKVAGFRSFCHNRGEVRSFRYDRIIAINKGA